MNVHKKTKKEGKKSQIFYIDKIEYLFLTSTCTTEKLKGQLYS